MKSNDFKRGLRAQIENAVAEAPRVSSLGTQIAEMGCAANPFMYGAICERGFERNLREDYTRKTTFTNDLSLAEWCFPMEGVRAVTDTLFRCVTSWNEDVEMFGELLLATNMKSWEHAARHNEDWSELYANLFYVVRDAYFDWFDESHPKHGEAIEYYYQYID